MTISCSLTRRKINSGSEQSIEFSSTLLLENVFEQNITNNSFFITKAEIEVISENEKKEEFVASIKFVKPDRYLISLKTKAGIEAVRMFITDDTIQINDRFNRIHYYGSPDKFYGKYGLKKELLSLIFGDYVNIACVNKDNGDCESDVLIVKCYDREIEIIYEIDCKRKKVKELRLIKEFREGELEILFNDFIKIAGIIIPQHIIITGIPDIKIMNVTIRKIDLPWEGDLEFVPGNKYERVEIL